MQENNQTRVQYYKRRHQKRKAWRNFVRVMACIVVFCTTYALILPAITMEKDAFCGIEVHVHEDACYGELSALVCQPDAGQPLLHTHDALCYNGDTLICQLQEKTAHIHSESCYETLTHEVHAHGETCYTPQRGNLLCELAEEEGHAHGETCYVPGETLLCTEAVREGHSHGEACYTYENQLTCALPETEGHSHSDTCYQSANRLVCTVAEGEEHSHADTCYETYAELICTEAEVAAHAHGEACHTQTQTLVCAEAEDPGHAHGDACYEQVLSCTLEEKEGHAHGDLCFEMVPTLSCGLEEREEAMTETVLVCTLEQVAVHQHEETCYTDGALTCGIICGAEHQHTEECVQNPAHTEENLICEIEVHEHTLPCFSDPSADVETREDWEETISRVELTGNWRQDILAIAKSQLGYNESTKNYIVEEDGETIKGYTRYGAWYGIPYGDWCAMYAAFCVRYAGVEGMPTDANCPNWIRQLDHLGLYHSENDYIPESGDLIFFDWNADGSSDHVGIVVETDGETVKTIEGNSGDTVAYHTYNLADSSIQGYGRLPYQMTEEQQALVDEVIALIEALPSADEIEAKIEEFEAAEDYEGEEAWMTEVYQQVGQAYVAYARLGEELQSFVTNRDKLLELEFIWSAIPLADTGVGYTIDFTSSMLASRNKFLLYTKVSDGNSDDKYYAINGSGQAIPVSVDSETGLVTADNTVNVDSLFWKFAKKDNSYTIQNVGTTSRYIRLNGSVTGNSQNLILTIADGEIKIRRNDTNNLGFSNGSFAIVNSSNNAAAFHLAAPTSVNVWFDGTCGGLESLAEASDVRKSHNNGGNFTHNPTSPSRYSYVIRGWYDIYNHKYYRADQPAVIAGDTVLYADWRAATYDIGQHDSYVVKTISTDHFIETKMFDYGAVFNMYSVVLDEANSSFTTTGNSPKHDEDWKEVGKNNPDAPVGYRDQKTLGFVFRDWDNGDEDLSFPKDRTDATNFFDSNNDPKFPFGIHSDLYRADRIAKLFSTANSTDPDSDSFVLGQEYLGTADHLFQYQDGYYFYNSQKNAAAYNRSAKRFYVYDYLTRTTDAYSQEQEELKDPAVFKDPGKYSDFLPLNYHTSNLNKYKDTISYSFTGDPTTGPNRQYNSKTIDEDTREAGLAAGTNLWFGMQMDIEFYLPNDAGRNFGTTEDPIWGNMDLQNRHMIFEFSGDDDVWILIGDGIDSKGNLINERMLLDLGGIHRITNGKIDFATGNIELSGEKRDDNAANLNDLEEELEENLATVEKGTHYLRMYYLERGDSQSNLSIKFNISPRYEMHFQKEDFLTGGLLDGAVFGVYTNVACTDAYKATLWSSREAYEANPDNATNTFTISDGNGSIWGMEAGSVYYIKELTAPDGYAANGIIKVSLDHLGEASYEVLSVVAGSPPGFTAYGFTIDPVTELVKMTITNGKADVPATQVKVSKVWTPADEAHPDSVEVYLKYNNRRLGDPVTLSAKNNWTYTWTNLPKTLDDGSRIVYTVEEVVGSAYIGVLSNPTITDDGITYTLTNVPASSTTDIPVTKQWQDIYGELMDADHPNAADFQDLEIEVKLLCNDEDTTKRLILKKDNNWTDTFEDLPVAENLRYSVVEVPLESDDWNCMEPVWSEETQSYIIVNRQKLRLPVEKVWDSNIPEAQRQTIRVELYTKAPGTDTLEYLDELMLSAENGWKNSYLVENPVAGTKYYVYEAAENFLPTYSNQANVSIKNVATTAGEIVVDPATDKPTTLVITNNAIINLPETGGSGHYLYITVGLALMLTSTVFLLYKFKKREQGI